MKRIIQLILILSLISQSHAEIPGSSLSESSRITFEFNQYPDKPVIVLLKKGISTDTIYTGTLDKNGKTSFTVPPQYTNHTGMATVKVEEASLDFIVNGKEEDLTIRSNDKYIYGNNTSFGNSPENESLQRWFMGQMNRLQKIAYLSGMEPLYNEKDKFARALKEEKGKLEKEQQAFEQEMKESPLYASKFIQLYNFLHTEVETLDFADSTRLASVRTYVCDSLDINNLYTSGIWFQTLNGLLALYDENTPFHKDFITDMSTLLRKTATDEIYTTLADNLISICESMGWGNLEQELAYTIINDGRIREPKGKIQMLMTLFKLAKGSKAPALSSGNNPLNTILVFYESGCGSCEDEMQSLKANYPVIKDKGYEVVSISADVDENIFKNTSHSFPWGNKLCDLKGFTGDDFQNYGIMGTPTFFVIDKNGEVKGRYARLQDTGILN